MGARWYNPAAGSFDNKDTVANKPVPDSASASPFGYAADNPLDRTDPTGHMAVIDINGEVVPAADTALINSIEAAALAAQKKAAADALAAAQKAALLKQLKSEYLIGGPAAIAAAAAGLNAVGTPAAKATVAQFEASIKTAAAPIRIPAGAPASMLVGSGSGSSAKSTSTAKPSNNPCLPPHLNVLLCFGADDNSGDESSSTAKTGNGLFGGTTCGVTPALSIGGIAALTTIACPPSSSSASGDDQTKTPEEFPQIKGTPNHEPTTKTQGCSSTCAKILTALVNGTLNAIGTAAGSPLTNGKYKNASVNWYQLLASFAIGAAGGYAGTLLTSAGLKDAIVQNFLLGIEVTAASDAASYLITKEPLSKSSACGIAEAGVYNALGGVVGEKITNEAESIVGGNLPGGAGGLEQGIQDPANFCSMLP